MELAVRLPFKSSKEVMLSLSPRTISAVRM